MPANPEGICRLFQQYMLWGDLDAGAFAIRSGVVFLNQARTERRGLEEMREELTPLVSSKPVFDFNSRQVIQSGEIALMHTMWKVSAGEEMSQYAISVAGRQLDGSWRWLIGDPFTVGRETSFQPRVMI